MTPIAEDHALDARRERVADLVAAVDGVSLPHATFRRRVLRWLPAALVMFVWIQSAEGRTQVVHANRATCERTVAGTLDNVRDRLDNAAAWRAAAEARRKSGDMNVAYDYELRSAHFDARADAGILRAGVPLTATASQITAVCVQRNPDPGPFALPGLA